ARDTRLTRRLLVADPAAARLASRLAVDESERVEERRVAVEVGRIRAHTVETLQRELARDVGMVGDQRLVRDVRDDEIVAQAFRIGERDAAGPVAPEVERLLRPDAPDDGV